MGRDIFHYQSFFTVDRDRRSIIFVGKFSRRKCSCVDDKTCYTQALQFSPWVAWNPYPNVIRPYHLKKGQNPYWIRTIRTMWHVWHEVTQESTDYYKAPRIEMIVNFKLTLERVWNRMCDVSTCFHTSWPHIGGCPYLGQATGHHQCVIKTCRRSKRCFNIGVAD